MIGSSRVAWRQSGKGADPALVVARRIDCGSVAAGRRAWRRGGHVRVRAVAAAIADLGCARRAARNLWPGLCAVAAVPRFCPVAGSSHADGGPELARRCLELAFPRRQDFPSSGLSIRSRNSWSSSGALRAGLTSSNPPSLQVWSSFVFSKCRARQERFTTSMASRVGRRHSARGAPLGPWETEPSVFPLATPTRCREERWRARRTNVRSGGRPCRRPSREDQRVRATELVIPGARAAAGGSGRGTGHAARSTPTGRSAAPRRSARPRTSLGDRR